VTRRVNIQNGTNGDQFAGEFEQNQVTVTWSGSNANGFSFTGNPGDLSTTTIPGFAFAEVGHMRDGIFASPDGADSGGLSGALAGSTFSIGRPVGAFPGFLWSSIGGDLGSVLPPQQGAFAVAFSPSEPPLELRGNISVAVQLPSASHLGNLSSDVSVERLWDAEKGVADQFMASLDVESLALSLGDLALARRN
jgi:hypothetical protein